MSSELFKDRLHISETPVQAQQLIDAIIKVSDDTKKLLFNTPNPDEYKGKYKEIEKEQSKWLLHSFW